MRLQRYDFFLIDFAVKKNNLPLPPNYITKILPTKSSIIITSGIYWAFSPFCHCGLDPQSPALHCSVAQHLALFQGIAGQARNDSPFSQSSSTPYGVVEG